MERPLLNAYVNVCFKLPKDEQAQLSDQSAVIITACNPHSLRLPDAENAKRNQLLQKELETRLFCKLLVGNEKDNWFEASYWVFISLKEGLLLAEKYQQNAIYWVKDQQVNLVYCADKQPIYIGELKDFWP
ncbi:DUF3293 domain-containing protein [Vibrio astriarenae]